ncbi:hypothetical protein DesyoDRAFT_1964 [Desulfosporosinus youngiae DSM 17734]|uniref:Uncharacterized protein n=1 Tax=Desulfosporosinus youngiae DSM 17734 TaxID=768710 RepID=H5Y3G2_9FIRM|nr:hypothetical protein DesyoDRAFT_1964 [Desulfosporosinus youngiae DSM 17734]
MWLPSSERIGTGTIVKIGVEFTVHQLYSNFLQVRLEWLEHGQHPSPGVFTAIPSATLGTPLMVVSCCLANLSPEHLKLVELGANGYLNQALDWQPLTACTKA